METSDRDVDLEEKVDVVASLRRSGINGNGRGMRSSSVGVPQSLLFGEVELMETKLSLNTTLAS